MNEDIINVDCIAEIITAGHRRERERVLSFFVINAVHQDIRISMPS